MHMNKIKLIKHLFFIFKILFTWCCRGMEEFVQVICSEDRGFDPMFYRLVLKWNEDLWLKARTSPEHWHILGDQGLQREGLKL